MLDIITWRVLSIYYKHYVRWIELLMLLLISDHHTYVYTSSAQWSYTHKFGDRT